MAYETLEYAWPVILLLRSGECAREKNADLLYSEYLTIKVHKTEQNMMKRKGVSGEKFLSLLTILNIQISKCWLYSYNQAYPNCLTIEIFSVYSKCSASYTKMKAGVAKTYNKFKNCQSSLHNLFLLQKKSLVSMLFLLLKQILLNIFSFNNASIAMPVYWRKKGLKPWRSWSTVWFRKHPIVFLLSPHSILWNTFCWIFINSKGNELSRISNYFSLTFGTVS